ncbi:MAG: 5-formyltetrahydrofolate cyclo-ligase [Prevotella sp.]|nr:5-formyltetrahydrofolate cyclo-ligase [Prevotella sp.]
MNPSVAEDVATAKRLMRQRIRQLSKARLTAAGGANTLSARQLSAVLPTPFASHTSLTILLYHALPDEVDTSLLIGELAAAGHHVLLPRVTGDTSMELRRYSSAADLQQGAYGIMEPTGPLFTDYAAVDIAIIPGMAFDLQGHRLGRGKGYYDRFLSSVSSQLSTESPQPAGDKSHIKKIGICHEWQVVGSVPALEHDVRMDALLVVREQSCRLVSCLSCAE